MKLKLSDKQLALFSIFAAVILGGGVAPLTKIAVREIPPFSYTFFRFIIAGITLLPFYLKEQPKIKKDFYKVLLFSLLLSANVILAPWGIKFTTATIAQTLYSVVPIIVAGLSYLLLAERLTKQKTIGVLLGFIGALIIIFLPIINGNSPFSGNLLGNLISILGVTLTALYTIFSKSFQKDYTPIQITSFFVFTTCILGFFFSLFDLHSSFGWWHHVSAAAIWATIYMGAIGASLWYLLYQYAIKHGSPMIASLTLYLQPVATFVWANLLLGEQVTTGFVFGVIITFIGIYLTIQSKPAKRN